MLAPYHVSDSVEAIARVRRQVLSSKARVDRSRTSLSETLTRVIESDARVGISPAASLALRRRADSIEKGPAGGR
jgi:hypothetical protein